MFEGHEPDYVAPTADAVLDVFCAWQEHVFAVGEADPIELAKDTTIEEWRQACDLGTWREIGQGLNEKWQIHVDDVTWRVLLTPWKERTLGGLCEYLAHAVKFPRARPVRILGKFCLQAGVFLTVRTLLAKCGADVSQLAPSTPIEPMACEHLDVFMGPITEMARLPDLKIKGRAHPAAVSMLAGLGMLAIGWLVTRTGRSDLAELLGAVMILLGVVALALAQALGMLVPAARPRSVQFGALRTFRDLSGFIAEQMQRSHASHANRQVAVDK